MKLGPDLWGFWGDENEGEEGKSYNVELAAPVLMLNELERPNMVADGTKRPAPRSTGFTMATVSFLLGVCGGVCYDQGRIEEGLTSLETCLDTIDSDYYCHNSLLTRWRCG